MKDYTTIEQIREDIVRFKNDSDFQELEKFYYSKSFSEILGVSRREISHSNFMAWLLGSIESHELGYFPIRKFLDILSKYSHNPFKNIHEDLLNIFATEDYVIEKLFVKSEYSIKTVGRIDIFIEFTLLVGDEVNNILIIVENKVESRENNDQTNKYYNYFNESESTKIIFFVYLTPISTLELEKLKEPECNCKSFIQINYQSIVDFLIEPALNQNISERTHSILSEYLKSLSQPSIDEESENKKILIMALGNKERKLLTSFWEKNQRLILASLYAISSDPKQDEETRDAVKEALSKISTKRDSSKFNLLYNGKVLKENFQKADIGLQTVRLLDEQGLINHEILEILKNDKSSGSNLIKKKEDMTKDDIKYNRYGSEKKSKVLPAPLIFEEEEYYVIRNWGKFNINKFMEKFRETFPGIDYQKIEN